MANTLQILHSQSAGQVEAYDFIEITIQVIGNLPDNPFTQVSINGEFQLDGVSRVRVDGFCDSPDGSVHRIRFMPTHPGQYTYQITYRQWPVEQIFHGRFRATDGGRKGLVRVDPRHPFHFLWEGTGEHYFWNATTTYSLLGCDEEMMLGNVERLHRLKVNRLRVGLSSARVESGEAWDEPIFPSEKFTFLLSPWPAARPDSVEDPGFDVSRFYLPFWQKVERLLGYARERDIQVSIIFYVDGARPGVYPFPKEYPNAWWGEEQHYYHYAINRLASFSNVMWDITNEWRLFRTEAWVEWMGNLIETADPYGHLTSCHGHEAFPFAASPWADFSMYQLWDETGNNMGMLRRREFQARIGHPKPVINEEYGYEDHYPRWGGGRVSPARSADNRRRLAWEMVMAGCYQTTGERAVPQGGWINGAGSDDTLFTLHGHMVDFFTGLEWWRMDPHNELVNIGNLCLAEPGCQYVAYLPQGGVVKMALRPGRYRVSWYNPRQGKFTPVLVPSTEQDQCELQAPDSEDWLLLLIRE
jgi:hypothetical protein